MRTRDPIKDHAKMRNANIALRGLVAYFEGLDDGLDGSAEAQWTRIKAKVWLPLPACQLTSRAMSSR